MQCNSHKGLVSPIETTPKVRLVTPQMELPTPKYGVPYVRFTNRINLRRAACVVAQFFNARNGAGSPQNGVANSILFRDPWCSTKDEEDKQRMKLWGCCALYPPWLRLKQTNAAVLHQCCHTCAVFVFFITRLLKINNAIKAENRRNRARKYINICYEVFHSKVVRAFPLILKICCVVF